MKATRNKGLSIPYSKSSPPLTKEQIARFDQNGYLILDLDFDAGFIDRLLAGVEPLYPAERLQNPTAIARCLENGRRGSSISCFSHCARCIRAALRSRRLAFSDT